jgi:hypothetical protein
MSIMTRRRSLETSLASALGIRTAMVNHAVEVSPLRARKCHGRCAARYVP